MRLFTLFIVLSNVCFPLLAEEHKGAFIYLNRFLSAAAAEAVKSNIIEKFPPGPARVRLRNMLKAVAGTGGRAFNTAIANYNGYYVLAVRAIFQQDLETVIPGNRAGSKFRREGHNFWWQDWSNSKLSGGTLYFIANPSLDLMEFLWPTPLSSSWATSSDIHLFDEQAVFSAKNDEIAANFELAKGMGASWIVFEKGLANRLRGNNYGLLTLDVPEKAYSYLDWFYKEGLKLTRFVDRVPTHFYLKYDDNFPILGEGSTVAEDNQAQENAGKMPLFSFGSNHLMLTQEEKIGLAGERVLPGKIFFGVGHSKILVDDDLFKYRDEAKIDLFRKRIIREFEAKYGDRYIPHDAFSAQHGIGKGYHYLMYFYYAVVDENNNLVAMHMSDSFLPTNLKENEASYVFSLAFPMSVARKDLDELIIGLGVGDYYSAFITLPKSVLFNLCRHDVTHLSMDDYDFKFMLFDGDNNVRITESIEDGIEEKTNISSGDIQ